MARLALAALAASLIGCATGPTPTSDSKPAKTIAPTGTATITGRATYDGPPRQAAPIDMDSVPACARQHYKPALDNSTLVDRTGGVANVYVWVKGGLPEAEWIVPPTNAHIDQIGCLYTPRVVAIQAGQGVEFTNHDPTNHNIHPVPQINAEVNRIQAPQGEPLVERFPAAEVGILIKCNVHPWMRAWVHVSSSPYFALTNADGSFKINNLPDGAYTLGAWHEKLGQLEAKVVVKKGESTAANFTFKE
ncbi:MAG: hypothetical protein WDN31_11290 [Hyphomicrobium sp.]